MKKLLLLCTIFTVQANFGMEELEAVKTSDVRNSFARDARNAYDNGDDATAESCYQQIIQQTDQANKDGMYYGAIVNLLALQDFEQVNDEKKRGVLSYLFVECINQKVDIESRIKGTYYYALWHESNGNIFPAIDLLQTSINQNNSPGHRWNALVHRSKWYMTLGELDKAEGDINMVSQEAYEDCELHRAYQESAKKLRECLVKLKSDQEEELNAGDSK